MTVREMWERHPAATVAAAVAVALLLAMWMKWSGDRTQALMDAYAPVHEQAAEQLHQRMQMDPTCWEKED